jgi:hypothetical protein
VWLRDPFGLRARAQKLFPTAVQRQADKYARCSVFPWGIRWVDGDEHVNARWEDITLTGVDGLSNPVHTSYGDYNYFYSYEYRVLLADGRSTTFQGMLNMIRANTSAAVELKPVLGTTTIVTIEQLGRLLKMGVSQVQFPKAIGLYNAGQAVSFGKLTVSQRGIAMGNQMVPWSDVKREKGSTWANVTVQKEGRSVRAWERVSLSSNIPNYFVFDELVQAILQARQPGPHTGS